MLVWCRDRSMDHPKAGAMRWGFKNAEAPANVMFALAQEILGVIAWTVNGYKPADLICNSVVISAP